MNNNVEFRVFDSKEEVVHEFPQSQGINIEISATQSALEIDSVNIDTQASDLLSTFQSNYNCWNSEVNVLSTNNYDNINFKKIVAMGDSVIPYIYQIIKEKPHPIVYALEQMMPGIVQREGYVPLNDVCKAWTSILPLIGKV